MVSTLLKHLCNLAVQDIMGFFKSLRVSPAIEAGGGLQTGGAPLAFGGPRAAGGPVYPGLAYPVGERGPELFMPRQAGTIIPNHRIGGNLKINFHIENNSGAPITGQPQVSWINHEEVIVRLVVNAAVNNRHGAGIFLGRV